MHCPICGKPALSNDAPCAHCISERLRRATVYQRMLGLTFNEALAQAIHDERRPVLI